MGTAGLTAGGLRARWPLLFLVCAWIAASRFAFAGADEWTPIGPFAAAGGNVVSALAVDPSFPSTIYAGTQDGTPTGVYGIFKSTNGGTTWSTLKGLHGSNRVAGSNIGVTALAISRESSSIIYVATNGSGILKSTDAGTSWSPSDNGISSPLVTSLVLDPLVPTTLYASARPACLPEPESPEFCTQVPGGTYRSTDAAVSWALLTAAPVVNSGTVLAIDPVTPSTLYAAPASSDLYKSTDSGSNWTALSGFPSLLVNSFVIDPHTPTTLYIAASRTSTAGGIYKSVNGGLTWVPVMSGLPTGTNEASALVVDPTAPTTLYVSYLGTSQGVAKSIDGGQSWTPSSSGPYSRSFAVDPVTPANVFAGAYGQGVHRSNDAGRSWNPTNSLFSPVFAKALAVGAQPPIVYLGTTTYGVFRSTDQGKSWLRTPLAPDYVSKLFTDPTTSLTVYAATSSGLFKSTDAGGHWRQADSGIPSIDITSLAIDPVTPSTMYAGVARLGIYKSTDGATTWTYTSNGVPSQILFSSQVGGIVIDPFLPSTVYAGFTGQFFGTPRGVFKSIDGGANWTASNTGLTEPQVLDLAIDPLDGRRLYAATSGNPYHVFQTLDGGDHWIGIPASQVPSEGPIAIDSGPPLALYMAYGMFVTTDGITSTSLNSGENPISPICFALDTPFSMLYVGTMGGVFQRHLLISRGPVASTVPRHRPPPVVAPR